MIPRLLLLTLFIPLVGWPGARVSDWPVKIARSYRVNAMTYVPAAALGYKALGYASWHGSDSGNRTANGGCPHRVYGWTR